MKIYLFTRYDNLGASSRVRFIQFFPILKSIKVRYKTQLSYKQQRIVKKYSFTAIFIFINFLCIHKKN